MHADQRTIQSVAHLGDRQGGSIGCKNAVLLYDLLQFRESLLLNGHALRTNLNYQIAVRADILQTGGDLAQDLLALLGGDLLLAYQEIDVLLDLGLTAVSELLLDVA